MTINFKVVETESDVTKLFNMIEIIWPEVFTAIIGEEQVTYMLAYYQSISKIQSEIDAAVDYIR